MFSLTWFDSDIDVTSMGPAPVHGHLKLIQTNGELGKEIK